MDINDIFSYQSCSSYEKGGVGPIGYIMINITVSSSLAS